ncbi:MAG: GDSL-type esterase/lipase family protein [Planctomycetota bacterium]|nr:GDSL-type esterase/lipase family protein [Planctomycetota bacterium]
MRSIRSFGDSITAGYFLGNGAPLPWNRQPPWWNPSLPPLPPDGNTYTPNTIGGGYRAFLAGNPGLRLVGNRTDNSAAWMWSGGQQGHDGFSGYKTTDLLHVVESLPSQFIQSDIILVHAGTNDILQNQTPTQTYENLKNLLGAILAKDARTMVVVAQIIPIFNPADSRSNPKVQEFNNYIPQLAGQLSSSWNRVVRSVDMYQGMLYPDDYWYYPSYPGIDGVHPGYLGYQKMAAKWSAMIESLPQLEPVSKPEFDPEYAAAAPTAEVDGELQAASRLMLGLPIDGE